MIELFFVMLLFAVTSLVYFWATTRQASHVVEDLLDELEESASEKLRVRLKSTSNFDQRLVAGLDYGSLGILSATQRRAHDLRVYITPWLLALVLTSIKSVLSSLTPYSFVVTAAVGLAGGHLLNGWLKKRTVSRFQRELEFYLPIVMERIVMAVQAGLDIIPAIKAVVDLEAHSARTDSLERVRSVLNPVSQLLKLVYQLTEAGLGFEQSLREVAAFVECSALRHAFVHLAVAQKEGGELVMPLRELSDATQLYYQESIEEEIARLPVKATLPLVCTFAGLIICFITAPLLQVMAMTSQAMIR